MKILEALVDTFSLSNREEFIQTGQDIGQLYTDMGLPIDIAMSKLENFNLTQKLAVLEGACIWLIEHKRNSGAGEKAIDRQRKVNNKMLSDFISKGEVGVY